MRLMRWLRRFGRARRDRAAAEMVAARVGPGGLDWMVSREALEAERAREFRETVAVVAQLGGALREGDVELDRLELSEAQLAGLVLILSQDPRVEFVRVADNPASARFVRTYRALVNTVKS